MYLLSDKVRVAVAANVHILPENEPSWRGTKTKRPTDRPTERRTHFSTENLSLAALAERADGRGRDRLLMAVNGHAFKFFRIHEYRVGSGRPRPDGRDRRSFTRITVGERSDRIIHAGITRRPSLFVRHRF